jgi:hypothetical protein
MWLETETGCGDDPDELPADGVRIDLGERHSDASSSVRSGVAPGCRHGPGVG